MRHATVWATLEIHPWSLRDLAAFGFRACDWGWEESEDLFAAEDAQALLDGREVDLPTCPACAALLDLALEMRGVA